MDRARVWATCVVVAVATGCTAITGADDFVVDRPSNEASATTPERSATSSTPAETESKKSGGTSTPPPPSSSDGGGPLPTLDGVACGFDACGGTKPKCCAHENGTSDCVAAESDCNDGLIFSCSDQSSCAQGTVCCFITNQGKPHGECRKANDCVLPSAILCDNDEECPSKHCAGEIAGLDYEVCLPY